MTKGNSVGNIKKTFLLLGIITIVTITLLAGSYGLLTVTEFSDNTQTVMAGEFNIHFKDGQALSLKNAVPVTDEDGMNSEEYKFTISNTGNVSANYLIRLEEDLSIDINKRLNANQIKYSLKEEDGTWSKPALLSSVPNLILVPNKSLASSSKINYSLKIWIDENVGNEGKNKSYGSRIVVEAIQDNPNFKKKIDNKPTITLKGSLSENVEENEVYTDPGVESIKDDKDNITKEEVKIKYEFYNGKETEEVTNIDTSKIGVYYIVYKVTDSSNNVGVATRTVNIYKKDTTPPTITLNGERNIHISQNKTFDDEGATAEDETDGDLTKNIVTVGKVNTKNPDTYTIKYLITDKEGNTASVTRTVIVSSTEVVTIKLTKGAKVSEIGSSNSLTCSKNVDDVSCDITLPTIKTEDGYIGYWTTSKISREKEIPGATVSVSKDTTYYALASKKIKVTYKMTDGVDKITKTSDSCLVFEKDESCNVILPTITPKLGYNTKFWSTDEDATHGISDRKTISVKEDTTYYAKALDDNKPVCKFESLNYNNNIAEVKINCTDTSGNITKDMTEDDLIILADKKEITLEEKTLDSTKNIKNGKQYIFSLKGISKVKTLTLKIKEKSLEDYSENKNTATIFSTKVTIK